MNKVELWNAACKISSGKQFMCHAVGRRKRVEFQDLLGEHRVSTSGTLSFHNGRRWRAGTFGYEAREVRFMFLLFLMHSGVAK